MLNSLRIRILNLLAHLSYNSFFPLSFEEAVKLEQDTILQFKCQLWFESWRKRVTAALFGKIFNRQKTVNTRFFNTLFDPKSFTSSATTYGKNHKTMAKGSYMEQNKNIHIHDCGLVVNPSYSFLGILLMGSCVYNGILEVKCPYSARDMVLVMLLTQL